MKPLKVLISFLGLCIAILILAVSLVSSTPSVYSAGDQPKTNDKEFYLEGDILPDHVLYPVVMMADKVKLTTARPEERLTLLVTYANLRLDSAEKLLHKKDQPLALSTLTKSQKYLLRAAQETINQQPTTTTTTFVYKTLLYHLNRHQQLKPYLTDSEKNVVDQLDQEIKVFVDSLKTTLGL